MVDMRLYIVRKNYHNEYTVVESHSEHTLPPDRPTIYSGWGSAEYWEVMATDEDAALREIGYDN